GVCRAGLRARERMVHVDVIGDGPRNVVLLHGCPSPPEHLGGLARALGETHRVYLVHHPGYGKAPAPGRPYSLADASEWIETALPSISEFARPRSSAIRPAPIGPSIWWCGAESSGTRRSRSRASAGFPPSSGRHIAAFPGSSSRASI